MTKIVASSPPAHEYLSKIPVGFWARHAFDTSPKIDHCTNNLSESFNSWIEPVRAFSVLSIMEGLRTQIMQRLVVRKKKGLRCTSVLMPRVLSKLNDNHEASRRCRVISEAGRAFEVQDYNYKFVVHLDTRSCDCRRWDVSGIPCRHAWATITYCMEEGEDYVSENQIGRAHV